MQEDLREAARRTFLVGAGFGGARVRPLAADASFRRYFRLSKADRTAILMDAPPPREDVRPFVRVARHLADLGLRAPQVFTHDPQAGFVLLEDFGDDTFTRLLAGGADERTLYRLAVDVLIALHADARATTVDLPCYDVTRLLEEAVLLVDWYYPAARGEPAPDAVRSAYLGIWREALASLPALAPTLVLRDFHVDNLMRVDATGGCARCGLLDFQDAVIGSPAYDLMSLLEDARRDVPERLARDMLRRYRDAMPANDPNAFALHYRVLAAQRHCKVAGIFVRLCRRDGKCDYLAHIPRVLALLERHLGEPALEPLAAWLDEHLPLRHEVRIAGHRGP